MASGGTYPNQIPVFVGMNHKEMVNWMKKENVYKDFIKSFDEEYKEDDWLKEGYHGRVCDDDGKVLLWIKDWKNDWESHDTLMHECLHIVQFMLNKHRLMEDEYEAQAYQLEYLVKSIRQKLNKEFYG